MHELAVEVGPNEQTEPIDATASSTAFAGLLVSGALLGMSVAISHASNSEIELEHVDD